MNLRAGRDVLAGILKGLGAEVIALGRADHFIPVDTEAVDPETRERIAGWVKSDALDALVSTDGDSDRPLLADETGQIVPGDILGQITAEALKARAVVTPISSNSGVTKKDCFDTVSRTRIGSPYVIAGMEDIGGRVVGYEANGGFLLGFEADGLRGRWAGRQAKAAQNPRLRLAHSFGVTCGPIGRQRQCARRKRAACRDPRRQVARGCSKQKFRAFGTTDQRPRCARGIPAELELDRRGTRSHRRSANNVNRQFGATYSPFRECPRVTALCRKQGCRGR